jgi:hypothetical protein
MRFAYVCVDPGEDTASFAGGSRGELVKIAREERISFEQDIDGGIMLVVAIGHTKRGWGLRILVHELR